MKFILHVPHPVLTVPAKTVTSFDNRLKRIIDEMKSILLSTKNPKGVGLAAPQIGEPYRVFMIKPTEKSAIRVFVNARIVARSEQVTDGVPQRENKLEGCLSIPKIWGRVKRAVSITLEYQDEKGIIHTEKFTGFPATIIQHETDHINGILFTRRVLEQKGTLYEPIQTNEGKEVLEAIELK